MTQTITKKPIKKSSPQRHKKPLTVWGKIRRSIRRRTQLLFVPHKANQFRPHAIRRYGLLTVVVLVIGIQVGYNYATTGRVLGSQQPVSASALLLDTNAERAKIALPALKTDDRLTQAAYLKAQDMLDQQYWAHQAPDGKTPWYWFGLTGYNYAYAGENLAKNFATAEATTVAWMGSPEHRANILDEQYTSVGFAVVEGMLNGRSTSLVVAMYAEPAGSSIASMGPAVAGARSSALIVDAPAPHALGMMARIGVAAESVSPAAVAGMFLVIMTALVSVMAHTYRKQLPRALRQSWYRHHGAIKAGGMLSLSVVMILIYSGGQI